MMRNQAHTKVCTTDLHGHYYVEGANNPGKRRENARATLNEPQITMARRQDQQMIRRYGFGSSAFYLLCPRRCRFK